EEETHQRPQQRPHVPLRRWTVKHATQAWRLRHGGHCTYVLLQRIMQWRVTHHHCSAPSKFAKSYYRVTHHHCSAPSKFAKSYYMVPYRCCLDTSRPFVLSPI